MNAKTEDQNSLPGAGALSPVRLAVFEGEGEQKQHLSTVTLKKAERFAWTFEATGPSAEGCVPSLSGLRRVAIRWPRVPCTCYNTARGCAG
jgi:hypothetical protein